MQAASTVFMVRPASFGYNPETAPSNYFQQQLPGLAAPDVQAQVLAEFDRAVTLLRAKGIRVLVFEDTAWPAKPDAVFPNNWGSFHADGRVLLYPMCAPNRRAERRPDLLQKLGQQFHIREVLDLSGAEAAGQFLEGTGSIIFDHRHRLAYAAVSPRTHPALLAEAAAHLGYRPVPFQALDAQGQAIYHTNVMMSIGEGFAVICLESIRDAAEQAAVRGALTATGHELVAISLAQVGQFAGNMLALQAPQGMVLALSQRAYEALAPEQRAVLAHHADLLPLPIPTIETIGGGSVRCLLAEVFLPAR